MKTWILSVLCVAIFLVFSSEAFARKRMPLFFNTGDELFEIYNAPRFEEGYSLGYACQHFGLFWADIATWDCQLMAVNLKEFSVIDLPPEMQTEYEKEYVLKDRKRNLWNHYGIFVIAAALVGLVVIKMRRE